jgi:hypothetical protein
VSNIPIALTLTDTNNNTQRILGMRADGLSTVARGLRDQTAKDGQAWSSLIVQSNGQDLRVLSPNSGITINNGYFQNYFNDYVNQGEAAIAISEVDSHIHADLLQFTPNTPTSLSLSTLKRASGT